MSELADRIQDKYDTMLSQRCFSRDRGMASVYKTTRNKRSLRRRHSLTGFVPREMMNWNLAEADGDLQLIGDQTEGVMPWIYGNSKRVEQAAKRAGCDWRRNNQEHRGEWVPEHVAALCEDD